MQTVREFLQARYLELKGSEEGFSFRAFSKEAGFGSPNYLKLVIDGKRNLSLVAIDKFSKGLRLSVVQAETFRKLVIDDRIARDPELAQILQHVTNKPVAQQEAGSR